MMHTRTLLLFFLIACFQFQLPIVAMAKVHVTATLPDLAALAREVGGARVEVKSLVPPTQDAHYIDARPSFIITLNKTDLLIHNGLDLEVSWLPSLINNARNSEILLGSRGNLNASSVVKVLQAPRAVVDRTQGDIHPGGNPHFLLDPSRAIPIAQAIAARLMLLDPKGSKEYEKNAKALVQQLTLLHKTQRARFLALPKSKRRIIAYHQSTIYLAQWLGLIEVLHLEPKPGIPPNPQHVARVLVTMREQGVRLIIQESYYPRKTSAKVAQLAKGKLVVVSGGASATQTYAQRIKLVTDAIFDAIEKTY